MPRQRFVLYLEPDRIALLRGHETVACVELPAAADAGEPPWERLGVAMQEVLARRAHRRGDRGDLDVVLSEGLCHLGLVRGAVAPLSAEEALALARHCFRLRLPAAPGAPDEAAFRAAPVKGDGGQRHLLCAALERPAVEHVRHALAGGAWSLRALRPRLVAAVANIGRDLERFSGHVLCADSRAAALVPMREGSWLQVMTRRIGADADGDGGGLACMLEQSEALAATGSREVWCFGDRAGARRLPGWNVHHGGDGLGRLKP